MKALQAASYTQSSVVGTFVIQCNLTGSMR